MRVQIDLRVNQGVGESISLSGVQRRVSSYAEYFAW
jgi:hypothetical protein